MSAIVPDMRSARPSSWRRVTWPVTRSQRQPPSSVRTRQSVTWLAMRPFSVATTEAVVAGRSSRWITSNSSVSVDTLGAASRPRNAPQPAPR